MAGLDPEKSTVAAATTNGRSATALNGNNGVLPLPPDGMYHVSDMSYGASTAGMLDPHGDKVSSSAASSSSTASVNWEDHHMMPGLPRRLPASTCV